MGSKRPIDGALCPRNTSEFGRGSDESTRKHYRSDPIAGQKNTIPGRRPDLAQHRLIRLVVESDDGDLPDAQCRRSKISSRPEHLLGHLGNRRILHLEDIELLPLCDVDLRRRLRDRSGFRRRKLPTGRNLFFDVDLFGIQKLGCSGTARSTLSDVIPVDRLRHVRFLLVQIPRSLIVDTQSPRCRALLDPLRRPLLGPLLEPSRSRRSGRRRLSRSR